MFATGSGVWAVRGVHLVTGIITATVLTGLGAALFDPALRTYLAHEADERRSEAFAMFAVSGHAGALVGPLLGGLRLRVDFRLVALVASVLFAVLTVVQAVMLPARPVPGHERGVLGSWWEIVTNRRFIAFTLAGSAHFALYNQIYLVVPVVLGTGFLPVMLTAPWLPTAAGEGSLAAAALAATPVLVGPIVLTVGVSMTLPFSMDLMPVVGSERLLGTHTGFFYLVSALVTAVVSWLV